MSMQKLAILLVSAVLIAGCAKKTKPDDAAGDLMGADDGFTTQPLPGDDLYGDGRAVGGEFGEFGAGETPAALVGQTTIYFDFDSAAIRADYSQALAAHAAQLAANPNMQVRLEGHTDERGSREYNIGLGERRANAIQRFLEAEGVSAVQINTISYGEERPVAFGQDEVSWAQNRRGVLVY